MFYYIIQLNSSSKENVILSRIHEIVIINSGSERCSIIAVDKSPNNSGVLIHFLLFAFSFCRYTSRVSRSSLLFEDEYYTPPDYLFISSYTVLAFNSFSHFFLAFCQTSLDGRKYGLEFWVAFP